MPCGSFLHPNIDCTAIASIFLNHLKIHIIDFAIHHYPTVVISEVSVFLSQPTGQIQKPYFVSIILALHVGQCVYKLFCFIEIVTYVFENG